MFEQQPTKEVSTPTLLIKLIAISIYTGKDPTLFFDELLDREPILKRYKYLLTSEEIEFFFKQYGPQIWQEVDRLIQKENKNSNQSNREDY